MLKYLLKWYLDLAFETKVVTGAALFVINFIGAAFCHDVLKNTSLWFSLEAGVLFFGLILWLLYQREEYLWLRCPACNYKVRIEKSEACNLPRKSPLPTVPCNICKSVDLAGVIVMHPFVRKYNTGLEQAIQARKQAEGFLAELRKKSDALKQD